MDQNYNIFKNSGIRKKVSDSFFAKQNIQALGYAVGQYLQNIHQEAINIVLATDTRPSGQILKQHLAQGLNQQDHALFDARIIPTPFVAQTLKSSSSYQFGIIITASHNPAEYNGFKFLTPTGYLDQQAELEISKLFNSYKQTQSDISTADSLLEPIDLIPSYITSINKHLVSKKFNQTILLDCAHGAAYDIAKKIFQSYGFTTISINNSAEGNLINKNSGCSNPKLLIKSIQKYKADWACAFDGDADRVILVHTSGQIFDGDDLLVALSQHPLLKNQTTFVGTIMTNQSTYDFLTTKKKTCIRTNVGERNLIQALQKHQALLGSESCGHITITSHAFCSDGIFAALLFFDTIALNAQNLIIPTKLLQLHVTVRLEEKNIEQTTIQTIVQNHEHHMNHGRIIARTSNTEPVLRIMVEHSSLQDAQKVLASLKKDFLKNIT